MPTPPRRIEGAVQPPGIEIEPGRGIRPADRAREGTLWSLAREIDETLGSRVILTSKRFPEGRDLDLTCRDPERAQIAAHLRRAGFIRRPRGVGGRVWTEQWARFSEGHIELVDLNPAERWGLASSALERLFAEAIPIPPLENVARPAPHHVLLLAARRLVRSGRLGAASRAVVLSAVQEAPSVWEQAARDARAWGCAQALRLLRSALEQGGEPSRRECILAQAELARAGRRTGWSRELLRRQVQARRPRRSHVIAFSGLDGAGKSTQVQALDAALSSLGAEVIVCWRPLGHSALLRRMRRAAKRLLGAPAHPEYRDHAAPARTWDPRPPTLALRERSALATRAWAGLVALLAGAQYRRCWLSHFGRGQVLVFDRFRLDAAAQLRFFYGSGGELTGALRLLSWLCPPATRSYLLDVPAEVAAARKPLQYDLEELGRQALLLREEAGRTGTRRLDGCAGAARLHEQIVRDVWAGLD
ncbi:MAG TPA: hypothetical protein VFN65_13115 [Solirubrobacteraceae bacterium]|nr:hypothetical protein [Solirubrobacteraceae bacterium]